MSVYTRGVTAGHTRAYVAICEMEGSQEPEARRSDDPRAHGDASPADALDVPHPQHDDTLDDDTRGWWSATGPSAERRWETLQRCDGDGDAPSVSGTAGSAAATATVEAE